MLQLISVLALTIVAGFLKEFAVSKIKSYAAGKLESIINKISERVIGRKLFEKKDPSELIEALRNETLSILREFGVKIENMEEEVIRVLNNVIEDIQGIRNDIRALSQYISTSFYEISKLISEDMVKRFDRLEADLKKMLSEMSEEEFRKISEEINATFLDLRNYFDAKFGQIIEGQKRIEQRQEEIINKLDMILKKLNIPLEMHTEVKEQINVEQKLTRDEREFLNMQFDISHMRRQLSVETLIQLGNYYIMSNNINKALEIFNSIIQTETNPYYQAIALNNVGFINWLLGDINKAIQYFQAALQKYPNYFMTYYNLGVIYQNANDYEKAIYYYQKAIEYNPMFPYAYYNLALIYQTMGNHAQAIQLYAKAVQYAPNFLMAWNNMALAYASIGNINQALAILNSLIQRVPNFALAWYNIGIIYLNMGQAGIAYQYFQRAVMLDPSLRERLRQLGVNL